ncbi:MAG: VanZ family protein [Desulforegulaceae bacterium]|nr:VanZ family protein [Desulforegulaceae bacterium]
MSILKKIKFPILFMILIFIESSIPLDGSSASPEFLMKLDPNIQNMLHIPLYAFLCILWLYSFQSLGFSFRKNIFFSFSITSIYGIFDEIHQTFIPGRYGGLTDVLLDVTGAFLGIILFRFIRRKNFFKTKS